MNYDNYSDEGNALNSVNITSNVRAPGEYKYYYCGENNAASDKSFLAFSTMWYTQQVSEDMIILASCYTPLYTCLLYYIPNKNFYYIYVYQNILDYKSENISLKPIQLIQLEHSIKEQEVISKKETTGVINKIVKIYFGADNYLLLNEIDKRILLIDFINGNYVTIFNNKEEKSQEPIYNIFDTYDENYYLEGEQRIRTFAFLSIKYQEKKVSYYKYKYFIIERGILENNYFFLHSIDLEMGDAEPVSLKIHKIPKQSGYKKDSDSGKSSQWFYIFCFLSTQRFYQIITNYGQLSFYQMLRSINQNNTNTSPYIENFEKERYSLTKRRSRKDNRIKQPEDDKINEEKNIEANNNIDKINDENNDSNFFSNSSKNMINFNIKINRIAFWSSSTILRFEKQQVSQGLNIFLNINTKKLSALILFFENGDIVTFPFNYNDSPEEIKNKITIPKTITEIKLDKIKSDTFGPLAKVFKFKEKYVFKSTTQCALTSKNLIIANDNKIRIYDLETYEKLFSYDFYKENIASLLLFNDIGNTFLLTSTKIFKIIFTSRFRILTQNEIINNPKCQVNNYLQEGMSYPLFEFSPEDVWNSYCSKLDIDSNNIKNSINNSLKSGISLISNKNNLYNDGQNEDKVCVICSKDAEYYCSDCNLRYYCCYEHFQYDYNLIHFYECQLVQFFRRKDIMSIENKDIRYIVLYNELIKLCGRILNFMFTRIFVRKDYHVFLEMLLNLIELLDNFGFYINLSEFCSCNLINSNNNKFRQKAEKVLFYQNCIYFYIHLQMLKCTFTSKCKLYNLSDCYMKIIKNDIIPKLSPKDKKKLLSLKCEKLYKNSIFKNEFFLNFQSPVFFDLKKLYNSLESSDYIDIVEIYIMHHLLALSLLIKFKIKLHSSIDLNDTFTDIPSMFDDHFRDKNLLKNVIPYCYFSLSFYLVEIGKVPNAVKLLKRMESFLNEKSDNRIKALTYYNLGVLQYALGEFKIGIHNIEIAYKKIVEFFLSEKFKNKVIVTLGLAYLNQRKLFKAYVLIQTSINELKKIKKKKYELKCIKLNAYLNYIIDLYEYSFITKARFQKNKANKDKDYNIHQLINFVECGDDKELIVIEQHVTEFLKVVEYVWNLSDDILQTLQKDNPPKITNNNKEEINHEKNISFTMEQSQMSTFIVKEPGTEKEESQEEYEEDIEVKPALFDSLTRQQQKDFIELKTAFLKRDIILRDSLGEIEKFNINYDPLYSKQFQKIIEKLKNNFLLKEIFYCFQNEKWRDDLYNYTPNNVLFGLSKYLKLEKIKNVIAIEKSKCLDMIKKEKTDFSKDQIYIDRQSFLKTDLLSKINTENNIYPNSSKQNVPSLGNQITIAQNNNNANNISLFSRYKNEEMNYIQFKRKFLASLKENEKNKNDSYKFVNLKDDYLVSLYKNVYLNNPEHDFIFQNPSLILNYIFIDISNNDNFKKEAKELILKQKSQEEENIINKSKVMKTNSFRNKKYNNMHSLKEDDSNHKVFSPFKNNNPDLSNNIHSEIISSSNYFNLKYDIKEDNLIICSKVSELSYIFIRKRMRSVTSNWAGKFFPSFSKKKMANERKSILPELFLKLNEKKETSKKKLSAGTANDNYIEMVEKNKPIVSNKRMSGAIQFNANSLQKKKRKTYKASNNSCQQLYDKLRIEFLLDDEKELDDQYKLKLSSDSDEDEDINQNENDKNEIKEKNSKGQKIENINNNNEGFNIEQNKNINNNIPDNELEKNNKLNEVKSNNDNNLNLENESKNQYKNKDDNNNKSEKDNDTENKNNILQKAEEEVKLINLNQNNQDSVKNSRTKTNKNRGFAKHNSVKEFNRANLILTSNIINRITTKKYKNLMITTKKKSMMMPKTYNFFSPTQIPEESINHYNENKKIVYSLSQKKLRNNDDYKNKEVKEFEFSNDSNKCLQQEYNNKNNKNKYINENYLLNNKAINLGTLQNKYKINENINISSKNKIIYKAPCINKKKGKQFGEESISYLNSTSSGFILNGISSYGDTSSFINRSIESDIFQKEMRRIINFNKRLKSKGKDNSEQSNISIIKKKIKKSISEPNFLGKKNKNILQNGEKSKFSKNNDVSKTSKNLSLLSTISKKNLNKPNNSTSFTTKNFFLNNSKINSFNNNINNKKFNIKSTLNKKPKISKVLFNKESSKINFIDDSLDKKNYSPKLNENNNDYIHDVKNVNHDNENSKFRFVLDKYIKKQKKRSPKPKNNIQNNKNRKKENKKRENFDENKKKENNAKVGKEEVNIEKNEDKHSSIGRNNKIMDNKNKIDNNNKNDNKIFNINSINIEKGENSDIISSISNKNIKDKNNIEKSNDNYDSFFKEGLNIEDLCDKNINEIKIDNKEAEINNNENINENKYDNDNDNNNDNYNDNHINKNNDNDNANKNNNSNNISNDNNYNNENNNNNNDIIINYDNIRNDEEIKNVTNDNQKSILSNNIKINNTNESKESLITKSNKSFKNSNNILEKESNNTNEIKYHISKERSSNSISCNELGEDLNVKGKINIPFFAGPIIRKASQERINNIKNNSNENKSENTNSIDNNNIYLNNNRNNYVINSNHSNEINSKSSINNSKKSSISSNSNNKGNMKNNLPCTNIKDINIFGNIINQKHERPKYKKK